MYWGNKFVISVVGGQGGIGKSCFAANLGVILSQMGKKVILVDADTGIANLSTILGIKEVEKTARDYINKRYDSLEKVLINSLCPNLRILSSAGEVLSNTCSNHKERKELLCEIQKLDVDVIVFDIATADHQRAIDFFTLMPLNVIIIQPFPVSLENAFTFLKNLLVRHLIRIFYSDEEIRLFIIKATDQKKTHSSMEISEILKDLESMAPQKIDDFRKQLTETGSKFYIISNNAKNVEQTSVTENFARIVKRYLTLDVAVLGNLPYEASMDDAISDGMPFAIQYPDAEFVNELREITKRIYSDATINHKTI